MDESDRVLIRGRLPEKEKMALFHMCLFEYLQRAEAYGNAVMCNNLIDTKGAEIAQLIGIVGFKVTARWREQFMTEYGIRPFLKVVPKGHVPEFTLHLERIFEHCWKEYKVKLLLQSDSEGVTNSETQSDTDSECPTAKTTKQRYVEKCDERKLDVLNACLYEYLRRAEAYANAVMCNNLIDTKAGQFAELMGLHNFTVDSAWRDRFMAKYNIRAGEKILKPGEVPEFTLHLVRIHLYVLDKILGTDNTNDDSMLEDINIQNQSNPNN